VRLGAPGSAFSLGANLPWIRYGGDFGANAWHPRGGVASAGVPAAVRAGVAMLRAHGADILRWFLFCDGRAGIRFDPEGVPSGLDDLVLTDLDAAVAFASDAGVRVVFTLFDFLWCGAPRDQGGVRLQGRRDVIARPEGRAALLRHVVEPVLRRLGRHPAVCAWDVINEPEWATFGVGSWHPRRAVSPGAMRAFIAEAAQTIRGHASQPVTVGLASTRGVDLVRDAALDFYQVHWYDRLDRHAPLDRPVAALGLERPIVLGEYPTRGSRRSPADIVATAYTAGYGGAWCWSLCAGDAASDCTAALDGLQLARASLVPDPASPAPSSAMVGEVSR
jgi:hypothetical protein